MADGSIRLCKKDQEEKEKTENELICSAEHISNCRTSEKIGIGAIFIIALSIVIASTQIEWTVGSQSEDVGPFSWPQATVLTLKNPETYPPATTPKRTCADRVIKMVGTIGRPVTGNEGWYGDCSLRVAAVMNQAAAGGTAGAHGAPTNHVRRSWNKGFLFSVPVLLSMPLFFFWGAIGAPIWSNGAWRKLADAPPLSAQS
ncbi:MAG: hypothetical protein JKP92_08195 [Alphaproteobacteria bacterium]|jgi:hypothetical protein|nr:hypothetical protein [Alphaproteobacteria bacterium]